MRLEKYLYLKRLTHSQFAEKADINRGLLYKLLRKKGILRKASYEKIIKATEGRVTMKDLLKQAENDD